MKKCLSGATLKWIAMISMLIDHFTAVFFEASVYKGPLVFSYKTYVILRGVGRLAFPIYCFLLVEGFLHTRSVKNYLLRLLAFGIVSEIPFDLALQSGVFDWSYQNVYFTLFLGLLAITLWERFTEGDWKSCGWGRVLLGLMFITAAAILAWAAKTDYGAWGVLVIVVLFLFRRNALARLAAAEGLLGAASTLELVSVVDFALFQLYNGSRGRQPKYLFYIFYPAHLLLLYLAAKAVYGI